jgi:hypothetical protein
MMTSKDKLERMCSGTCGLFKVISDNFSAGTEETHENTLYRMASLLNATETLETPNIKLDS